MMKLVSTSVLSVALAAGATSGASAQDDGAGDPVAVYVVPVQGDVSVEMLREVRDGLQDAARQGIATVLVNINSRGGKDSVALKLMEAIDQFEGTSIAYVNSEAIGASALVAAIADEIYFAPQGLMGAAAVVLEAGDDPNLKLRLESYLQAKTRTHLKHHPHRGAVVRAMTESGFVLEIGGETIKPAGGLLTVTADESVRPVGDPPRPLLANGVESSVEAVLAAKFGAGQFRLAGRNAPLGSVALPGAEGETTSDASPDASPGKPRDVYVIPIEGTIAGPNLYILRRAVKEALTNNVQTLVLDLNTPGGSVAIMDEFMEILQRFDGETVTYINPDAISAGAFIAVASDAIYFSPTGRIGAAAAITATGEDLPDTMGEKMNSYLRAKVRTLSGVNPRKAKVVRAMMDKDYELVIDGEVYKPAGELLTLTASEAMTEYGTPPTPLLGDGIHESISDLLEARYGAGGFNEKSFEVTWSERAAKYLNPMIPLFIALGILAIYLEFKTPGVGIFGFVGLAMILIGFALNYVAGLAGHEALLFFFIGLALLAVEILVFPGTLVAGFLGVCCILGSLIWSMADIWPAGSGVEISFETFTGPLVKLAVAMLIAAVGGAALWNYLPQTSIYSKLVLLGRVADPNPVVAGGATGAISRGDTALPEVGSRGVASTDIRPGGEVEIGGRRYQARVSVGAIDRGEPIVVVGHRSFALKVKRDEAPAQA